MEIVCRELRVKLSMFAVSASWFRITDTDDLFEAHEREFGIHGGESETSVMLHLHPNLVDMQKAETSCRGRSRSRANTHSCLPKELSGSAGKRKTYRRRARAGTRARRMRRAAASRIDRAADALIKLIDEVSRYPLESITQKTRYSQS